jgi:nicotinate-nucleotide adenylyltransferase
LRLGVFGGSFNPPHIGHVLLGVDAIEALGLDRLIVVPASANPLKGANPGGASPTQRLEMTRLAFADDPRFEVSDMEIRRGGLSYTVDTLEALAGKYAGAELVLVLGSDAVAAFDRWSRPDRILKLARLAILARSTEEKSKLPVGATIVTARRIDVSSSEIRRRVADGKSIKGFVADPVERFIRDAQLYTS